VDLILILSKYLRRFSEEVLPERVFLEKIYLETFLEEEVGPGLTKFALEETFIM